MILPFPSSLDLLVWRIPLILVLVKGLVIAGNLLPFDLILAGTKFFRP